MSQKVENQPAFILHRRAYKETSLILDLITLDYGRISLVAKGATRTSKRRSGLNAAVLQPFQPLLVSWSGRGELKNLTQVEVPSAALNIRGMGLYCAYYINELCTLLLPNGELATSVFALYSEAIERVSDKQKMEAALRHFEFELLSELGVLPDFSHDIDGMLLEENGDYTFLPEQGFCLSDSDLAGDSMIYPGHFILALDDRCFSNDSFKLESELSSTYLRLAKILMRYLIDESINYREIKSRELFKQLKRGEQGV